MGGHNNANTWYHISEQYEQDVFVKFLFLHTFSPGSKKSKKKKKNLDFNTKGHNHCPRCHVKGHYQVSMYFKYQLPYLL